MKVVVVVPVLNEMENLKVLIPEILSEKKVSSLVVVNDGSSDGSDELLLRMSQHAKKNLFIAGGKKRRGKAAALKEGFEVALKNGADVIVMMDGDGQDRPEEIPRLLNLLERQEADLVTGARTKRNDRLTKRYVSKLYNWTTAKLTKTPSKDLNSGLKIMTSDVAEDLLGYLYGDLHRYITVITHWQGYTVKDVSVAHHARMSGRSKYGAQRFWRGFIDLVTVRFLLKYNARPNHFFGAVAIASLLVGAALLLWMGFEWIMGNGVGTRPALLAGVFLTLSGFQLLTFGLLAELLANKSFAGKTPSSRLLAKEVQ